jgi:hypothetical protein
MIPDRLELLASGESIAGAASDQKATPSTKLTHDPWARLSHRSDTPHLHPWRVIADTR